MSLAEQMLNRGVLPDFLIRYGIRRLNRQRLRSEERGGEAGHRARMRDWIRQMGESPIALLTAAANSQHYEVPTEFFQRVLGPRLKYSCCYFESGVESLEQAELAMLELYVERAEIVDGMELLELGCGWGSLSLYLAERFPHSRVLGVSNSRTQKSFIDGQARQRGLSNLEIITSDMNDFHTPRSFDRVVSVEMLEHMRNWRSLFAKIAGWMKNDARFFFHIFTHRRFAYPFEDQGPSDWMARHFFSGGMMPSADLPSYFQDDLSLERQWVVEGRHYERTSELWLKSLDSAESEVLPLFEKTYGKGEAKKWFVYWRVFFMACAELWGFKQGSEWQVSHYLFNKKGRRD